MAPRRANTLDAKGTSSLVVRVSPESTEVVEVVQSLIGPHGFVLDRLPHDSDAFGL